MIPFSVFSFTFTFPPFFAVSFLYFSFDKSYFMIIFLFVDKLSMIKKAGDLGTSHWFPAIAAYI